MAGFYPFSAPSAREKVECPPLFVQTLYERCRRSRRKGPQEIGTILVGVLARLGVSGLELEPEAQGPIANVSEPST